ncbi:DUF4232 domain-containing protein [Kitasatospora sp. NPDC059795]|uniref:DUF4232 domain-containing protein n=1 Tax=Kitasatospora sp. NPDC059795 TaxID=3346949 RepID=UPI00366588BF
MRTRQLTAAVGLVAALGLTLTACGDDVDGSGDAGAAKAPAPAATASNAGQQAPNPPASSPSGTPESPKAATPQAANSQAGGSRTCTAADLKAALGPGSGAQTPDAQGVEQIEPTNRSKSACTMKGYPGLDLVGDKGTWSLPRYQAAQGELVTLQPGGKAYVVVDWSGANPQDQSGATHPGTYVRPVAAKL